MRRGPGDRHPPLLQAGPGLAVEPEAIERQHAAAGRGILQHRPAVGEAAALQDAARGGVDDPRRGLHVRHLRIGEGGVDHRLHGLRREAVPPPFGREEQAEPGAGGERLEPDDADRLAFGALARDHELEPETGGVLGAPAIDPPGRLALRVGVGHMGRHLRDGLVAGDGGHGPGVPGHRPAQPQPPRFQAENVVSRDLGKHDAAPSPEGPPQRYPGNDEGEVTPTSPRAPLRAWTGEPLRLP